MNIMKYLGDGLKKLPKNLQHFILNICSNKLG